jgi:hypothetical protein
VDNERRKAVRIAKRIIAMYAGVNDRTGAKVWDETQVLDISESGMRITTMQLFSLGEVLSFRLKLPSEPIRWMEISGEVVDCSGLRKKFGESANSINVTRIRFLDLEEGIKESLRKYIACFLVYGDDEK